METDYGFIDLLNIYKASKISSQEIDAITIRTEQLEVKNDLVLDYIDANKNVVSDVNRKLITEDKDSFVDTVNIQWTQNNRAFTGDTIQDITPTSNPIFNNLQLDGKLTTNGGIESKGDIDASNNTIECKRLNASDNILQGDLGGTPAINTPITWSQSLVGTSITITDLGSNQYEIKKPSNNLTPGARSVENFNTNQEMNIDFVIQNANSSANMIFGIFSDDGSWTDYNTKFDVIPEATRWLRYVSSNQRINCDTTTQGLNNTITFPYNTGFDIFLTGASFIKLTYSSISGFRFSYSVNGITFIPFSPYFNLDSYYNYAIVVQDGNTADSYFTFNPVSGNITTNPVAPLPEKNLTIVDESIFYDNVYLDNLTADKNLILDSNKIIKTEDKDTINGTTNQIIVNQVNRDFTLSAPQDLDTNANFQGATLNTGGLGNNLLYGMDQDVKTSSTVEFENVKVDIDLIIDTRNAWEILYVDSLKEVRGIKLNDDEVIVGTANNPIARRIGEFYELHQNQLGSKFDPEKTSQYIALFEDGLTAIKANNTNRARVMCINYFEMPRFGVGEFNVRFGFEIVGVGNQVNVGFCPGTSSLDNPLLSESGNYSIASNGNIYENGIFITQIATTFTAGDIIEYEVLQSTNFYYIYKNGTLIYNSFSPIIAGQYYPQVFDNTVVLSSFKVNVYQTYRGTVKSKYITTEDNIDFSVGFTKYLTFDNTALFPYTNLSYNLGKPGTNEWNNIYTSRVWAEVVNVSSQINNDTGIIVNGTGSNTAPSYTFSGNTNSGFYMSLTTAPRQLSFTINGSRSYSWQQTFFVPERTSGTQDLGLTGRRWKTVYCTNIVQGSDERIKKDIVDIDVGLNELMKLKPKKYKFKNNDDKEHYGLIAQQLVKDTNIKNVVSYDEKEDEYEMNYIELIPILIKSIQDLKNEVNELKSKLNI